MVTLNINLDVPNTEIYDLKALQEQLTAFAKLLVKMPSIRKKEQVEEVAEEDPFACFSGDWGGDRDPHEIAEEIHNSHCFNRVIEDL